MATGGYENIILPKFFQSPGEALQNATNLQERRTERDEAQRQQELKIQQQNRLSNIGRIDKATASDQFNIGDKLLDANSQKFLVDFKNDLLTNHINDDPAQLEYIINNGMKEFAQWDNAAKTEYGNLKQTLMDVNKVLPNMNLSKAHNILMDEFANQFMKQDENGNWVRKNELEYNNKRDYSEILSNPEVLGNITEDTTPLDTYLTQGNTQDVKAKYKRDNKGKVEAIGYTGKINPVLHELSGKPDENGVITGIPNVNFKTDVTGQALTDEAYNQGIINTPAKAASFYKYYYQSAKPVFEKAIQEKYGAPYKIVEGTPEDIEFKKRAALQYAKQRTQPMLNPDVQEKTPKPPNIHINFGQQQRDTANQLIDNIVNSVRSGDEESLKQLTSYFKRGNTPFKLEEAFFVPGSNKKKIALQYYVLGTKDGKPTKKLQERYFQSDDPYLRDKIIAEYQQDMGSTVPVEQLPYVAPNVAPIIGSPKSTKGQSKYGQKSLD